MRVMLTVGLVVSAAFGILTNSVGAQSRRDAVQAIVDSAAVARTAYASAARATSTQAALASLLQAARGWPTQPAYWSATARVAARLSDTAIVVESLVALSTLQTGGDVLADSAVRRLTLEAVAASVVPTNAKVKSANAYRALANATLATAVQELSRQSAPIVGGHVAVTIADSLLFAEGLDADPRSDALYVASVRHRTIVEVSANGITRDLNLSRHKGVGAILGVRVAPDGRTVYATTAGLPAMSGYTAADSTLAAVLHIRIADGALLQRWDAPADGARHLMGDLAIDADGTVYASDSYAPVLYRLRVGATTLESFRHPLFRSLQGVAPVPATTMVIVADYSHGLLRLNIADSSVTRIADVAGSTSLGFDGIVWYGDGIVGVQNGMTPARVVQLSLTDNFQSIARMDILDRQPVLADEPTIGTLWRGGFIYVANSQWEKHDDNGNRRAGTTLQNTRLICIPLSPRPSSSLQPTSPPPASRSASSRSASSTDSTHAASGTARNGTRSTTSVPPSPPVCSINDASPE